MGRQKLTLKDMWICAMLMHACYSYGGSHLALASVMGGKDQPYHIALFAPLTTDWTMVLEVLDPTGPFRFVPPAPDPN